MATPPRETDLRLPGRTLAPGAACGPVRLNGPHRSPEEMRGAILVTPRATPDDTGRILVAAGVVTFGGPLLSHVAHIAQELCKPALRLHGPPPGLVEDDVVLVDADRGALIVPAGGDRQLASRLKTLNDLLTRWVERPDDGRALVARAGDVGAAGLRFVTHALFLYLGGGDDAAARWLGALRTAVSEDEVVALLDVTAEHLREQARARHERYSDLAAGSGDPGELDRIAREGRQALERSALLHRLLSGEARAIEERISRLERSNERARSRLLEDLDRHLEITLALSDHELIPRFGRARQLLRRAEAARIQPARRERLARRLRALVAAAGRIGDSPLVHALDGAVVDRRVVGGKAAGLISAAAVLPDGVSIPPGFVVTTAGYRLHLLGETGSRLARAVDGGGAPAEVSRKARAAILAGPIPQEVADAVRREVAARQLLPVAVRSSATLEDVPGVSLAGQFDTVLGVRDADEVLARVRAAWASLWNVRALRALGYRGRSPTELAQAVIVQHAVATRAAGVLRTREPGEGAGTMLIEAVWGLGEAICRGETAGDLFRVRRADGRLLSRDSALDGSRIVLAAEGGTREEALPGELRGRAPLDEIDLARLAQLARQLEAATGRAQEIEFGVDACGGLLLFQARSLPGPGGGALSADAQE